MANLSNLITQTVGSSSGGVNLITAPNQSTIWTATGLTLSTTTTASELPLAGFSNTATKFALTGSVTSAYVDFDVPSALLQSKLQLLWYARASVTTIGNITLSLASYASSANRTSNISPTTVTLQTSSVASAAQSFLTTFDVASQSFFRLTLSFPAASGQWYTLGQLVVGPGQLVQGAAVGEWQSFTLSSSLNNEGTLSNSVAFYKLDGSDMLVQFYTRMTTDPSTVVTFTPPNNLTLDTSKLNTDTGNDLVLGNVKVLDVGTQTFFGSVNYRPGTGIVFSTSNGVVSAGSPMAWTGTDNWTAEFRIPIAEWAGNGTVNLGAGAQVEYAADDGSSDVFGPNGALVPNVAFGTGTTTRVFSFQYPQQATQSLCVELNTGNGWAKSADFFPFMGGNNANSNNFYGIRGYWSSSTQFTVEFGNQGTRTDISTASNGAASWATVYGLGYRFRVAKASPSSPVGFGLAGTDGSSGLYKAGQAPGLATGATIASGYIGEIKTWASAPTTQVLTTSTADWTNASITLSPGIWQISANITVQVATGTSAADNTTGVVYVTDSTNTVIQNMESGVAVTTPSAASTLVASALAFSAVVNIGTSTTYKIRGIRIDGAGTGSAQLRNQGASYSRFYAVRIA